MQFSPKSIRDFRDLAWPEGWSKTGIPLRVHLALFAAMLLIPALLLSGLLIRDAAGERRREAEARVVQLASDLADDISNDLERSLTILRTLSISQSLALGDLEAFHAQSRQTLVGREAVIILLDPAGHQLMNTALEWGSPLGPYSAAADLQRAVETKEPVVTDMFWGQLRNRWVINVLLPVVDIGTVKRVLVLSITPDRIRRLLDGQDIGGEWTTTVSDRNGQIVARSRRHEEYLGKRLNADLYQTKESPRTPHSVIGMDGERIVRAIAHTRLGDWMVAASVSEAYLGQLVYQATRDLIIGTALILGLATVLVALYARELAKALGSVSTAMTGKPPVTIVREATDVARALSEASTALRQSEERFRGIYQNAATGIVIASLDGHLQSCNPAFAQMLGRSENDLERVRLQDLVHPDDRMESDKLLAELAGGQRAVLELERRYLGADGDLIWAYEHVSIMRDVDGAPHLVALVTDRTERLKHEQELAIAVERSKIAQHSAKAALYELLPRRGQIHFDASITAVTGFTPRETTALSDARRALVHPDDAPAANAAIDAGLRDGSGYDTTYRLRHKDGHYIWVHDRASLLKGRHGGDDRVIGMLLDISDQKAREEHIHLLLREVNHRSKNMLGLVQAIARQTASSDSHAFLSDFSERLQALSANQDLLVRNDWNGVGIRALVSAQLAHLADGHGKRIVTDGPDLRLSPAAAQVLGMALHELATNASKYGALANEEGRIDVRWQRQDDQFSISWQEENGPEVVPPARQGFGTTVLRTMAAMSLDADVSLSYPASGLSWNLSCPLSKVVDAGKASSSHFATRAVQQATPERRARILVVEDEALIAMEIVDVLTRQGYGIVGPTRSVEQALALFREYGCDMAVLDVNLGAQTAEPIVKDLTANAIPYLLVSGYDREQQPTALRTSPLVTKPIRPDVLVAEVRRCLAAVAA